MKILLVNPPFPTKAQPMPPLGLGYIGAYLSKLDGVDVRLLDLSRNGSRLLTKMKSYKPDLVCITGLSTQYEEMKGCAMVAKKVREDALVVVGGIHASALPEFILKDCEHIDIVVKGEGEYSLGWFLKTGTPVGIPGMYYRNDTAIEGIEPEVIGNLDSLPSPWSFLDLEDYDGNRVNGILKPKGRQAVSVISSRGCPYQCSFCSASQAHGRKIRLRSVDNFMEELEGLMSRGVKEIQILDDNFTFYKEHAYSVCDAMIKEGLRLSWTLPNGIRADRTDYDLLRRMKEAGCYYMGVGIESGSEAVLELMHKKLSLDSVSRVIVNAKSLGIITQGFLLVGIPGETPEDLDRTSRYVRSLPLDRISINQAMPYPGTELFDEYFSKSGLTFDRLHRTTMGGSLPNETKRFARNLYLKFYLNPFRLVGHVSKFRSLNQWESLLGGLQMLISEVNR